MSAAVDERLRALGYRVPPRHHRTRLVRCGDGRLTSATIPCRDPACTFCRTPPARRLASR
jgi:hypothetical protein